MVGFVRFPASPRHVGLDLGRDLSRQAAGRAARVLLMVDPADSDLDESVAAIGPDIIQLHGTETPDRVAAIRRATGIPVMKAIGIASADDLGAIAAYRLVADRILVDAKPPRGAALPGGNGATFDWAILHRLDDAAGLMLSGGLSASNVAQALTSTGLLAVDVSSGVETRPGEKDAASMSAFVAAARGALLGSTRRPVPHHNQSGRAA